MKYIKTFEKSTLNPTSSRVQLNPLRDISEFLKNILEKLKQVDDTSTNKTNTNYSKVYVQYNKNNSIKIAFSKLNGYYNYSDVLKITLSMNDSGDVKMNIKCKLNTDINIVENATKVKDFIKTKLINYESKDIYKTEDCYEFQWHKIDEIRKNLRDIYEFLNMINDTNKYNL